MTFDTITFTGVDDHTDLVRLAAVARTYPDFIGEFGVLVGSASWKHPGGIFPTIQMVEDLRDLGRILGFKTALHLCGDPARNLMKDLTEDQDPKLSLDVYRLSRGFSRVQINLHGGSWNPGRIEVNAKRVDVIMPFLGGKSVILQHRGDWDSVPPIKSARVEYLFDRSEGRGETDFDSWPALPKLGTLKRVGYAGGIGPDNIDRAAAFAERAEVPVWLDMESRVRTNGLFDLDKVEDTYRRAIAARNHEEEGHGDDRAYAAARQAQVVTVHMDPVVCPQCGYERS